MEPQSFPSSARDVYTVSRLNREAKALLESGFAAIWLEGEISNLAQPASGHLYFSLKDERTQVRCALFRGAQRSLGFVPENGMLVLVRARVSLYEARGEFQLIAERLEPAGEGELRRAFEALKARLAAEGLFDTARKKPLPRLPRRIGIITSPSGAVLHDILTTLARRFPAIPVLVHPVAVQGEGSAGEIAAAILLASSRKDCDALILARGGGSLEDLWAFNEEIVARAIHACDIPLVSGVGHETDFTIADLAADQRAPTPTAAAELLSPHQEEWQALFRQHQRRFLQHMVDVLNDARQNLDWASGRLVHPQQRIEAIRERLGGLMRRLVLAQQTQLKTRTAVLASLRARLQQAVPPPRIQALLLRFQHLSSLLTAAVGHHLDRRKQQLQSLARRLDTLSPLATLDRGYAIVHRKGETTVIRDAARLKPGESIETRLARGMLESIVEKIHEGQT